MHVCEYIHTHLISGSLHQQNTTDCLQVMWIIEHLLVSICATLVVTYFEHQTFSNVITSILPGFKYLPMSHILSAGFCTSSM